MAMVYCRACGTQLHESAPLCPQCGAPQASRYGADAAARRGFGSSVAICFRKYAVFSGRAPRAEFWYFTLFSIVFGVIARAVDEVMLNQAGFLTAIESLIVFLPSIAVQVRRLHDLDRTGWWFWIILIPIIGALVLLVWNCTRGTSGPNRYGQDQLPARFLTSYATS